MAKPQIVDRLDKHEIDPGAHAALFGPKIPIKLTAATVFYVDPVSGSDSNNGLSAGTAFKTIQYGLSHIANNYILDVSNSGASLGASLRLAAGEYDEDIIVPNYLNTGGRLEIYFMPGAVLKGTIATGRNFRGHWLNIANATIQYAGRQTVGSSSWAALFINAGEVWLSGTTTIIHGPENEKAKRSIWLLGASIVQIRGPMNIDAETGSAIFVVSGYSEIVQYADVTVNGVAPSGVIVTEQHSTYDTCGYSITGEVIGKRCNVGYGCTINLRALEESSIPGTIASTGHGINGGMILRTGGNIKAAVAAAYVTPGGATNSAAFGFASCSKTGTGVYTLTLSNNTGAARSVFASIFGAETYAGYSVIVTATAESITVRTFNSNGTAVDASFTVSAF
jgi:hypothetical protein